MSLSTLPVLFLVIFFLRKGDLKCTKEDLIDMNLTLNTDTWAGGIVTTDLLPQVTLIFVKYHE